MSPTKKSSPGNPVAYQGLPHSVQPARSAFALTSELPRSIGPTCMHLDVQGLALLPDRL